MFDKTQTFFYIIGCTNLSNLCECHINLKSLTLDEVLYNPLDHLDNKNEITLLREINPKPPTHINLLDFDFNYGQEHK